MEETNNVIRDPFHKWVSLYVDGIKVSDTVKFYGCTCTAALLRFHGKPYPVDLDVGGIKNFSWAAPLTVGEHIVKLVIAIPDVKPLEYEWYFKIK
jgi:hypothetical protein